ncbi:MAG: LpqB family beta-propeller domain-containing protein [Gemmatimonadales bacterium]
MKPALLACAGLVCLATSAAPPPPPAPRPVTVDDLMQLRSIADVRISPDGRRVAYVVSSVSFEDNAYVPALYVVDAHGGTPRRLAPATRIANRPLPRPMLRWSPDGATLSLLALIDDVPQVVTVDPGSGDARPVTAVKEGVASYALAPDGRRLAFVAPEPASADEERRRRDRTYVVRVDRDERPVRLWVQDVAGGAGARSLTPRAHFVHAIDWTPDGGQLVYSASSRTGFLAPYYTRIYRVPVAGGEPQPVVDRPGMNTAPRVSPDGHWIAFVSTDRQMGVMATRGLHVVPSTGGESRYLTRALEAWVEDFVWLPDGRSILLQPHEGTYSHAEHMFEQHIVQVRLADGRVEALTQGPTVQYSLSLSVDGSRLAYRSVTAATMGDVFVMETASRRATRVTEVNPELAELDLGPLRPIRWRSFDGLEIWGLLLTPPRSAPGTRLPLLVYCHGGPIGGFTYGIFPQFMHTLGQVDPYPAQAMASAGMAILFPMPRGGSGYGVQSFRSIVNAWGEGDYRDIMAGVDHVIVEGIADPDRLGVMGASYGGFMTSWIVTQTDRFKAASTGASVNDLADAYYLGEGGDFMIEYFGLPWEPRAVYAAHSPLTFAAHVKTPLLIQHGENDRRVPLAQSQKFYRALKAHQATVEFDIYPRGGHVLTEPAQQREAMRRNLEWFTRWLKPVH